MVLIVSTRVTVIDCSYFEPTVGALGLISVYPYKHPQVELSLEAKYRLNIPAMLIGNRVDGIQNNSQSILLEAVDLSSGSTVIIETFMEIRPASHSSICAGGAQKPPVFDRSNRGLQEGYNRTVRIKIYYIESVA